MEPVMQMVLDITTSAQLEGDANDAKTPLGSFAAAVGAELTDHLRVLEMAVKMEKERAQRREESGRK